MRLSILLIMTSHRRLSNSSLNLRRVKEPGAKKDGSRSKKLRNRWGCEVVKLHISPEAQRDLHDIKNYITTELENPAAANNTLSRITLAIRGLLDFPDIGAPLKSIMYGQADYRYLVSGNYLVFYRHDSDSIYVVRVLYGKRDYLKILFGDHTADAELLN